LAIEIEEKCQNCGKLLEDSLLTHCSEICYFEEYLKSQSAKINSIETSVNPV
jgi:hypothetical protein